MLTVALRRNGCQVSLAVALANVKSEGLMLSDHMRVVGEEVRSCRAREPIQHFAAGPLDQMAYFQPPGTRRAGLIVRVPIDFTPRLLENRAKTPRDGFECAHMRARMGIATVRTRGGVNEGVSAAGPAGRRSYRAMPKPGTSEVPTGIAEAVAVRNYHGIELHGGRRGIGERWADPRGRLQQDTGVFDGKIKHKEVAGMMHGDECGIKERRTAAKLLDAFDTPLTAR